MNPPTYAELDCISNFSFLQGASHPEELVQRAAQLGYEALALSDECSLAGVVRAWTEAKKQRIKLIIGSRFKLDGMHIIILARTLNGYGNLSELITLARRSCDKGQYQLSLQNILAPSSGHEHLAHMPDCLVIFKPGYGASMSELDTHIPLLQQAFPGRLWLGLSLHHQYADAQHLATLQAAAERFDLKLVATGQVQMHVRSRQPMHDTITAIRLKQTVQDCGYALQANAEHYLRGRLRLANIYPEQALRETLFLSRLCTFELKEIQYQYPKEITPAGMTPSSYLRQETFAGAHRRYPKGVSAQLKSQLESELAIIAGLQYEPYFLTVYEIVRFARSHDILCQGRGSAANSAVCYCLGITEVDPENGNALFARFISQARKEPPDIDVDFEHQRREEVIQHIYKKYGRDRAALTAVVSTYRSRSVLRDTGKALGLDIELIDKVAKSFHYWSGKQSLLEKIAEHGLDANARTAQMWAGLAETLMGFPRHLSQHPGGFVIAHDSLYRLVPIENAAMPERSVVQWDKDDLDAMGLLKVDILALGMLSALQRCLKLVSARRGQAFAMQNIESDDAETFAMIQRADTIGVFQIESRAQMSMLPRLKPKVFYDLVVQVAIVRPGPIQGGMVHPYLRRRQGVEDCDDSPTPEIAKVLERTLGVPIFQEQAMQIAMVAANFSADEADELRRSMAAWRRKGGVDAFRDRLIQGMINNGCPEDFAKSIFRQLEGFGEYGFPESHSASFAKLAYISAWLKCHEPEAFLTALLNSQPMGFYLPNQLVQDARRHQVVVLPSDIMISRWEAGLEPLGNSKRPAVRLGLNQIKGLSEAAALRIECARKQQAFSCVQDLAVRADLNRSAMDALAAANALHALSGHRRQARWQAASQTFQGLLRNAPIIDLLPPSLSAPTEGQSIKSDYQSLGLTLGRHPLALLRSTLQTRQFTQASTLNTYPDRRLARACGIVTGRQRPQTAKGVIFVTLEDETGNVNVIVRAALAESQRAELLESELMGVFGIWQSHQGVCHLMASRLVNLSHLLGGLPTRSRNFH
ncbi:DNA polymerase III alpha subunit [Pusillimonas sp. T7-7]|uniref:error-prone DNA polymerase n=1 Tax=Pusillimonas sp. (strain T7-7) TaxID=1007105 RepID=UPI0002085800|nr:error-prone DNA polymerase [Pusillimonas sp. T7-7]AEC19755.1 DNA polymerase III alpha subunit [Pusillimonas sp. T7-7]